MNLIVSLNPQEHTTLEQRAKRFGYDIKTFARLALVDFTPIPTESLSDYTHPTRVKQAIQRARKDYAQGKIHTSL